MSNLTEHTTVAVITATIGRTSLHRTIQSVQTQTYPCKHYIFVDGEQYHQAVKEIVKDYPNVIVIYLPMNTGAGGMYNSYINAVAPFLVQEEIICYLDDDNWIDKHHVEYLVQDMVQYHTDYAYSLRYYVDDKGQMICEDNSESLGFWKAPKQFHHAITNTQHIGNEHTKVNTTIGAEYLIDVSCFAFRKSLARELAIVWTYQGMDNDQRITHYLRMSGYAGICTGKRTLYYYADVQKLICSEGVQSLAHYTFSQLLEFKKSVLKQQNELVKQDILKQCAKLPWECKTLFKDGQFIVLE